MILESSDILAWIIPTVAGWITALITIIWKFDKRITRNEYTVENHEKRIDTAEHKLENHEFRIDKMEKIEHV